MKIRTGDIRAALDLAIGRIATEEELQEFINRLEHREIQDWLKKEANRQKLKIRLKERTENLEPTQFPVAECAYTERTAARGEIS